MFSSDIAWKYKQHKGLIKNGKKHSIIKDLLSKENRRKSFEAWNELPRMVARSMGCEFTKDTPNLALNEVFVEKIYDVEGFVPNANQIVYDIGASYGDTAIYWSRVRGARVLSFEPLSDIYRILEANVVLNNANVGTFNIAVGDGNTLRSTRGNNMLGKSHMTDSPLVETTRLDDMGIQKMDILKIDVEGFELDVLNGAMHCIEKLKPRIIIETHSIELRNYCDRFLRKMGYSLEVQGRKIKLKHNWMDEIQNLFYAN